MPELKDLNNIYLIAAFIVPGLIITYVRSQFITGRMEKISDAALGYLVLALIYYGFSIPLIWWILSFEQGLAKTLLWWALIIIGPTIFGALIGVAAQKEWLRKLGERCHLQLVHDTPTSWDWRFSNLRRGHYVIVTLIDGAQIYGLFGSASFASSDGTERDIYVQEILDFVEEKWEPRANKSGVLVIGREIRSIEFFGVSVNGGQEQSAAD